MSDNAPKAMWMELWGLVKYVKCDLKCNLIKTYYFNCHEDFKILSGVERKACAERE